MAKGGKKKKDKPQKENKDQLSAVDQTFFELTITDLNNKLSHLRTHNAKLEQRNEELETEMAQLNEDRADVTAFLDRSLNTQACSIKDLEEKLTELSKVRQEETKNFQDIIKGWEVKYKAMHDQLTSEIKLLTGKLNSLEEFRIQKDELMTKFDQQENDLKEQNQRHKVEKYEMERKQIVDKDRLKKEVESKLVQLSNEFRKSNELRIASHVQRLVRENIALNTELDRLLVTHRRMESEAQAILMRHADTRNMSKSLMAENKELVKMCEKYLNTIRQLTVECKAFRENRNQIDQTESMRKLAETREMNARKEMNEFKSKVGHLERDLHAQKDDCQAHSARELQHDQNADHLLGVLQQVKNAIRSAIELREATIEGPVFSEVQRKNMLVELEGLLANIKDTGTTTAQRVSESPMVELMSVPKYLYKKGTTGILPKHSTSTLFKFNRQSYRTALPKVGTEVLRLLQTDLDVCEIIDVGSDGKSTNRMSMAESVGSIELLKTE